MRPVIRTVGGREVELRLTLDALDEIAETNAMFGEMAVAFATGLWSWKEVRAVLTAAFRPHKMKLVDVLDELGSVDAAQELAAELWKAAMPKASGGNAPAVVEDQPGSTSATSSATA